MTQQQAQRWCGAFAALVAATLAFPAARETLRAPAVGARAASEVSPGDAAARLAAGERIVFVDVREPAEFAEFHIPGARSMPLRQLHTADLAELSEASLVIPYCLKDFRGADGARILQRRGLTNVTRLAGFGVKAWKGAGLPLAGRPPLPDDAAALEQLRSRAREVRP